MGRLVAVVLVGTLLTVAWLDHRVRKGFDDGHWLYPVRLLSAASEVRPGTDLAASGFWRELAARRYRRVSGRPLEAGTWTRTGHSVELALFEGDGPPRAEAGAKVQLDLEGERLVRIRSSGQGGLLDALRFAPQAIEGVFDQHFVRRPRLSIEDIPPGVVDAVLAAEDVRFLEHPGVNPSSMLRAFAANLRAGRILQGGSTITQQFVKNHFLTRDRTFSRKLVEIPMALLLEWHFAKERILEAYLATVYLGHRDGRAVHGFAEGARAWLGKELADLTLADGAMLAGLIRAPNIYSPSRHPGRAVERRDQVIDALERLGWVGREEAEQARRERPRLATVPAAPVESFFARRVSREIENKAPGAFDLGAGVEIFTTLDPRLQRIVAEEVAASVPARHGAEAAVVALDPRSGAIRALVGGNDYGKSHLDRATQSRRPIGSLFKPFLYAAAIADPKANLTAATVLNDGPLQLGEGETAWVPRNSDGRWHGPVTVREALVRSLNVPAVLVGERLGFDQLARLGELVFSSPEPLPVTPAISLGAFEASLLDVVAGFAAFVVPGQVVEPRAIEAVHGPSGAFLYGSEPSFRQVGDPAAFYVVHTMLEGVVSEGTARRIGAAGLGRPIAGKTGTTNDARDAWFVGYTPSLLLGVWVGHDDGRPLQGDASSLAVPLWLAIARRAFAGQPVETFPIPQAVEVVAIDDKTGLRGEPACGSARPYAFLRGTAPLESCDGRSVAGSPSLLPPVERLRAWWDSALGGLLSPDGAD